MQALLRLPEIPLEITITYLPFSLLTIKLTDSHNASSAVTAPEIIPPATVQPPVKPADLPATYSNRVCPTSDKTSPGDHTALPGMAYQVAPSSHAHMANTGAPFVAPDLIMPSNVPSFHDLFVIDTTFILDTWLTLLQDTISYTTFQDTPNSICFGFDMGVTSPPSFTYTPPNHNSANSYPTHVMSHIHDELQHHRYTSPFSRSRLEYLISHFCTSPLGTVPKVGSSSEQRVIQDLSYPRNDPILPSVNDGIDSELFTCNWGTFNDVRTLVVKALTNTEAATLDVDLAFRPCPIIPSQQSSFIVHWNNLFYIDHNAPFGAASSGGVFGRMADAFSSILDSKGFGPSKNWVDNFVFFRYPISSDSHVPSFTYSLTEIYDLAAYLGWPWKDSKTKPFLSCFKYSGFIWSLSDKTIEIPAEKKECYFLKLAPWIPGQKFSRKDTELILGTLVHCSLALLDGRS